MKNEAKIQSILTEASALVEAIDPDNGKPKHSDVRKLRRALRLLKELLS